MKQTPIFRPLLILFCALLFIFAGCDGGPLTDGDAGAEDASIQEQDTETYDGDSEDVGGPEDTGSENPDSGDGDSEAPDTDDGDPDSGDTGDAGSEPELGTDHYPRVSSFLGGLSGCPENPHLSTSQRSSIFL